MTKIPPLGHTMRDVITGFTGVVTGHATYISGCSQCLLVPPMKDDKLADSQWFDEQRLRIVDGTEKVVLDNSETPGPDKQAPKR